jgi:MOSC domain-containing protein YiiM
MYSQEHYPRWHQDLGRPDLGPGVFGENLTVSGLDEASTCIGDVLTIGAVRLEVTTPRGPCTTLARRLGVPEIIRLVLGNHRSGWYLKVLTEGLLEAGMAVSLIHRPHPEWSVVRAADAHLHRRAVPAEARLLAQLPGLMPEWREELLEVTNAG